MHLQCSPIYIGFLFHHHVLLRQITCQISAMWPFLLDKCHHWPLLSLTSFMPYLTSTQRLMYGDTLSRSTSLAAAQS